MASPTRPRVRARRSGESLTSYDSRTSFTDDRDGAHGGGPTARNGIAALGVAGFLRHKFKQRRDRKEERRVAEVRQREQENERIVRDNSRRQRRHTGDGAPRHSSRDTRRTSLPETSAITGSNPELSRHTLRPPPLPTTNTRLPTGDIPTLGNRTVVFDGIPVGGTTLPPNTTLAPTTTAPVFVPPATYDPPVITYNTASAPGPYIPPTNGPNPNNNILQDVAAAAAAGAAAGAAANSSRHRSTSRHRSSNGEGSVGSPPVSVKVKMHNDGRHVTLRRLNEAEAAAERDARRRERHRRRAGSLSSVSGNDDRWRRVEAREAAEAQQTAAGGGPRPHDPMPTTLPPPPPGPPPPNSMAYPGPAIGAPPPPAHAYQTQTQTQMPLPPPPPIPAAASAMGGSVGSPGACGTETDVSNYDSNRRRRRAERAQAKLAAKQSGSRVEFT